MSSAADEMGDRLTKIDMSRRFWGVPFSGEGLALIKHNFAWAEAYSPTK